MSNCKNTQKNACGQKKNTCGQQKEETHSYNCQCQHEMPCNKGTHMDMGVCGHSSKLYPMLQTYTTKVLQPTMCCGKKVLLTQQMMACEDYKYVIRWDFDLGGKTILVPENCILEFDGGTLRNGTIIGQDTYINDVGGLGVDVLFGPGLTREGTWRMNEGGGSFEQVQSDWSQKDSTKPDYIKNKPTIPEGSVVDNHLSETSTNPVQNKVVTEAISENRTGVSSVNRTLLQLVERVATDESAAAASKVALEAGLQTEKTQRENSDTTINARIAAEEEARAQKDTSLDNDIAGLRTGLGNVYNKTEVNNLISNTPESDVVVVQGQEGVDPVSLLPATGTANTLYRIMAASGDSFSEYGWNGSTYVLLANKDTGVDATPMPGSSKFVTSDGVAKSIGICDIKNGTFETDDNPNFVRTYFIPTRGHKALKLETDRPNSPNCTYLVAWMAVSSEELIYSFENVDSSDERFVARREFTRNDQTSFNLFDVEANKTAVAVGFAIAEVNTSTLEFTNLRKSSFDGYKVIIRDGVAILNELKNDNYCIIRNGTVSNNGNSDNICTCFIPLNGANVVSFETNRPNRANCEYRIGWSTLLTNEYDYSLPIWANISSELKGFNRTSWHVRRGFSVVLETNKGYKSIACTIGEYNETTGAFIPLRVTDFNGYYVRLFKNKISNDSNRIVEICNGSVFNKANTNYVSTEYVRTKNAKFVGIRTNRPNKEGCVYLYGWGVTPNESFLGEIDATQEELLIKRDIVPGGTNNIVDLRDVNNAVGVAFTIAEFDTKNNTYKALRLSDFDGYETTIICSNTDETIYDDVETSTEECYLRNGTSGNIGNTSAVSILGVPTFDFSTFTLGTTRPNAVGYHYLYSVSFLKFAHGDGYGVLNERTEWTDQQYTKSTFVRNQAESKGIQISIYERSDSDDSVHPLRISDFDGYEVFITRSGKFDENAIIHNNQDKIVMLDAACRYRKYNEQDKDFQCILISDTHDDFPAMQHALNASNGMLSIDAVINLGDTVADYMPIGNPRFDIWRDKVKNINTPFYCVIGNHDAGNYVPVMGTPTDEELYQAFIKPSVDAGHLKAGEYIENKCYYYHDFTDRGVRLIVLNEYEVPLILDETYWKAIPYNESLPKVSWNRTYSAGTEINDFYYTKHSFRAVRDVTIGAFIGVSEQLPRYKYARGHRWMSQEQAQWFLNTLLSTPSDYNVIVALHSPYSNNAGVLQDAKFSKKGEFVDGIDNDVNWYENDFIADAINAFQNGTSFTANCVSKYPVDIPGYTVSADFSNKNSGAKLHSILFGHLHRDLVWKHKTYNQFAVSPICADTLMVARVSGADIRRACSFQSSENDVDCLTVLTVREGKAILTKLGADFTEDFEKRDFEVINIS